MPLNCAKSRLTFAECVIYLRQRGGRTQPPQQPDLWPTAISAPCATSAGMAWAQVVRNWYAKDIADRTGFQGVDTATDG